MVRFCPFPSSGFRFNSPGTISYRYWDRIAIGLLGHLSSDPRCFLVSSQAPVVRLSDRGPLIWDSTTLASNFRSLDSVDSCLGTFCRGLNNYHYDGPLLRIAGVAIVSYTSNQDTYVNTYTLGQNNYQHHLNYV